ncbi:secretion pathway protein sls2 rcy1 [Zalerion maritima]|uniref:Secretion pathway protein sls2 rcy1 n=1 Tax=Zalerion maritima TaxID=339359 RepID=A0AAD5WV07_9PEZI|nr:secretion pathway protein sls2 rcy1 [Zalerion maritima]
MYNTRRAAPPQRGTILGSLKATEMLDIKPILPAEIASQIIDYLPVSDQLRFARTSRKYREMVYDDTRWVSRLASLGCWSEAEARQRYEDAVRRKREAAERANAARAAQQGGPRQPQQRQQHPPQSTTLFDAAKEEKRKHTSQQMSGLTDGFETMNLGLATPVAPTAPPKDPMSDPDALLDVLKTVRSIRGFARQEFGKVYGALAPFYYDLVKAKSHTDPILFKLFRDPERQAKMLSNLHTFAKSDWSSGWRQREEKLTAMSGLFEGAVLREFEQGYELWDVDGRMRRFAGILETLNGGDASQELFIHRHPLLTDPTVNVNPMDCINRSQPESIDLEPSRVFFDTLGRKVNEQSGVITRTFPRPADVFWAFLDKVREDIISEYVNALFDETHERTISSYLKAVSGVFEQALQFMKSVDAPIDPNEPVEAETPDTPMKPTKPVLSARAKEFLLKIFEPHLDLYLQEELDFFTKHAETEVGNWEKKLSEQDASVENFFMSNFQRQAEKKDFLSSFKKVVMMPVTVLPVFSSSSAKSQATAANGNRDSLTPGTSRSATPGLGAAFEKKGTPLPEKAPTDELAAKAQLMASRLEGIKSLFSLEMALNLVHAAKSSLGRASVFIQLRGQVGEEAREQCASVFVNLLKVLGSGHMKTGFDKAITHLGHYKARDVSDHSEANGVAPLVMFIELANVGDLISQMIDVFYEQQLSTTKIADKNDFLDPSGLAKKKFEQMLDESVAAGLNKGIDVLMDEVEYLCATLQTPGDYNPSGADPGGSTGVPDKRASTLGVTSTANQSVVMDLGPTETAKRIVELVSGHTGMLVGSTDKSMLDVFNGEVGLRLFTALCKHLKRQRISVDGAVKLIADMNLYFDFVRKFKNPDLLAYFRALRELSQIYLIDPRHAKEMATIIADGDRFAGVFRAEEVYEFAERRADWFLVKRDVERAMYGLECLLM